MASSSSNVGLAVLYMTLSAVLVYAEDVCASYGPVNIQNSVCLDRTVPSDLESFSSSAMLAHLTEVCSKSREYFDCMDEFVTDCSNKDIIMENVRNAKSMCNGTDVLDWIKQYVIPEFNQIDAGCITLDWPRCQNVAAEIGLPNDAPFHESPAYVLDGTKRYKDAWFNCLKTMVQDVVQTNPDCGDTPWQTVYVYVLLASGSAGEPLGMNLDDTNMEYLKRFAIETNI